MAKVRCADGVVREVVDNVEVRRLPYLGRPGFAPMTCTPKTWSGGRVRTGIEDKANWHGNHPIC